MSFIENLYLKRQLQALIEENIKLTEIINLQEAKRYPKLKSSKLSSGLSKAHETIQQMFQNNPAAIAMGTNLNPEDIMLAYSQGDFALLQALSRKNQKALGSGGHSSISSDLVDHVSNDPTDSVVQTLLQRAIQSAHARSTMPRDQFSSWKQQNPVYSAPVQQPQEDKLEEALHLKKNPMLPDNMTLHDKLMSWTRSSRPIGGAELPIGSEEEDTMAPMMGNLGYEEITDPETGKKKLLKKKM